MSIVNLSEIFISKMTKDDIDDVVAIEEEAYGKHHWSKSSFYDEMSNNLAKYYVAKVSNGEIAGYAGTWHIIDEGHITTIAVKNEYLRNHIISIEKLFEKKETIKLQEKNLEKFLNGVKIDIDKKDGIYKIYDDKEKFIGIGVEKNKKMKRDVIL